MLHSEGVRVGEVDEVARVLCVCLDVPFLDGTAPGVARHLDLASDGARQVGVVRGVGNTYAVTQLAVHEADAQ